MKINLQKSFFKEKEYEFLTHGKITVSAFKYDSGVEALRITNPRCTFVFLPFQGQQVWNFTVDGKDLSMITPVKEPVPTKEYFATYGGFLYHCGINAFGKNQKWDDHPLHGETPNIEYNTAYINCGEDKDGKYIELCGVLDYNVAFTKHYKFTPCCRFYEDGTLLHIDSKLENLRMETMEYMYLCHLNFRPIDGAELIYSAKRDSEHIKTQKIIPDSMPEESKKRLSRYMDMLEENPAVMDKVGNPDEFYDPEICFIMKYEKDEEGKAHTMQYIKGEGACYVNHEPDVLPFCIRWIVRKGTEDSMGMALPATAEHYGYTNAKEKGQIKYLAPGAEVHFRVTAGYLDDADAKKVAEKIDRIIK